MKNFKSLYINTFKGRNVVLINFSNQIKFFTTNKYNTDDTNNLEKQTENKLKTAKINSSDNTIGLPEEFLDDSLLLKDEADKKSKLVTAEVTKSDDDTTIAKESKNKQTKRSKRGDSLGTKETSNKSYPHGYDKI
jgi:hypothetical protein